MSKRRHVDHGSALGAAPGSATKIASTEGAAAATAVSSSTDLIFEILSRLPVKTLCRFRCASKQWHSLVSDRAFVAAHGSRAEPLLVGRFSNSSLRLMNMDGNVVRTIGGLHAPRMLCTSLDGLACFAFANHSVDPGVIDLATGEMLLTPSNRRSLFHIRHHLRNKYDYGFGRTAVSQVYKVVRLCGSGRSFYECQVLTLGDGARWRQAQSPTTPVCRSDYQTSVAIAGVLHFLVSDKKIVLCFDLESEEWTRTIKCPEQEMDDEYESLLFEKTRKIIIAELNGALRIAQTDLYRNRYSCTDIWLLNDSDKSICRSLVYTIQLGATVHLVKPLRIMSDGRKLLLSYIHICTSQPVLQVYDPLANTCRDVMVTTTGLTNIMGLCKLPLDRFI